MATEPKSFGEFAASVFSALDTSAYVPASVLVGLSWTMLEIRMAGGSVSGAFASIAETRFGGAVVAIAAVFVVAAGIAPFQFFFIRALEGYAMPRLIARPLEGFYAIRWARLDARLRWWEHREAHLEEALDILIESQDNVVESPADHACADQGCPIHKPLGRLAKLVVEHSPAKIHDRVEIAIAYVCYLRRSGTRLEIDKRRDQLTYVAKKAERLALRRNSLPDVDRLLPLPLGNRLRAHEDALTRQLGAALSQRLVEDYVVDVYDSLPVSLRFRHDRIKGQLEGYCTLVFVLLVLAVGPFLSFESRGRATVVSIVLVVMASASYAAAIAAAGAYGRILGTIVNEPLPRKLAANSRNRRPPTRPSLGAAQSRVI